MKNFLFLLMTIFAVSSCQKDAVPKPYGELRLDYPKPVYQKFQACSYQFDVSNFAKISDAKKPCWYYISYPKMKAMVLVTYFPVNHDLDLQIQESEQMVYKHTIKASSIDTKSFSYPEKKVFGNFYELKGEVASNVQFYITDSTKNFVTANLYFNSRPKPDSLAPAVDYVRNDLLHMIDTFEWKN